MKTISIKEITMKDFLNNEIHVGDEGISTVKHYAELSYVEVIKILPKTLKVKILKSSGHDYLCLDNGTRKLIYPHQFVVMKSNSKQRS